MLFRRELLAFTAAGEVKRRDALPLLLQLGPVLLTLVYEAGRRPVNSSAMSLIHGCFQERFLRSTLEKFSQKFFRDDLQIKGDYAFD